jgi:hypothetical protein
VDSRCNSLNKKNLAAMCIANLLSTSFVIFLTKYCTFEVFEPVDDTVCFVRKKVDNFLQLRDRERRWKKFIYENIRNFSDIMLCIFILLLTGVESSSSQTFPIVFSIIYHDDLISFPCSLWALLFIKYFAERRKWAYKLCFGHDIFIELLVMMWVLLEHRYV